MNRDKIRNFIKYYTSFFFWLVVILGVALLLFYPRISSIVLESKRERSWAQFESTLRSEKKVDAQQYWKLREFYGIGEAVYSSEGFNPSVPDYIFEKMGLSIDSSKLDLPFLIYHSPRFTSIDSVVTSPTLDTIVDPESIELVEQYREENMILLKTSTRYTLIFLLPVSEMKEANGYFNYNDPEVQKKLEGKHWLNISEIRL